MNSFVSEFMGDPAARHNTISDVLDGRAAAEAEEARQIAEVRESFKQEKKTGPKGPTGPRKAIAVATEPTRVLPKPTIRAWIKPSRSSQGMPIIAIERNGDLRIRSLVRREMATGEKLFIRVAAEGGCLWMEPCPGNDPFARKVGTSGNVGGGSLRHEITAAGFTLGRSYLVTRELDGCWLARADQEGIPNG